MKTDSTSNFSSNFSSNFRQFIPGSPELPMCKTISQIMDKHYAADSNHVYLMYVGENKVLCGSATNDRPLQHGYGYSFEYDIEAKKFRYLKKDISKHTLEAIKQDIEGYFKKYPVL